MKVYCSPLTNDTLFDGRLICRQYRQGYRFSVDPVLAAHFCSVQPGETVLDLGCGNGVISLILAYRNPEAKVTGLEIQPELAMLAHDNMLANNLDERVEVIEGDLKKIADHISPESFDLVVSNPPYRQTESGRISDTDQKARARHEIDATLEDIINAAAFAVKNRGRLVVVYPAKRAMTLIHLMKVRNLEPKRLQPVYSYPGETEACLVLVEAIKNGGEEVRILPPFYIYTEKNGPYTRQMRELYI